MDVPTHSKCDIYDENMEDVILVHGSVQDCQVLQPYFAPCILPKTCHQVKTIFITRDPQTVEPSIKINQSARGNRSAVRYFQFLETSGNIPPLKWKGQCKTTV